MSNGTKKITSDLLRDRLAMVLDSYRGLLRSDEKQLHEAMLQFERRCWNDFAKHAA